MTGTSPEYQYHLKDHLGNVRTTFTTQRAVDNSIGTFEAANYNTEQSLFLRYDDARVINSTLFDHTYYHQTPPTAGAFSERLSGSANEKTGIARSISVMPGDTVNLTVYAKYVDPANSNNTAALTQFLAQIIAGTASAGTVIDGPNYSVNGITPFPYTGLAGEGRSTGTGPKAYLNYLVFDRNFVFVNGGYVQVSTAAKEDGTNVPHQQLTAQVIINQPGYVYTYLSNESTSPIEVYFDDFTVQQIKSPVVQQEDFYPFGLAFNSYQRENTVPNKLNLFQNQEHIDDLGLNWDSYRYRNHQPDIGRFFNIDPMSDAFYYNSPYAFSENKVTAHREMEGLEAFFIHGTGQDNSMWKKDVANFIMRELKPYFSTEQTADLGFNWSKDAANSTPMQRVLGGGARNWLNNSEKDRGAAARQLVSYILKHRQEGQGITLVGHSHGGNVAIQAARILFEKHNISVNIVNFNTPAFNGVNDPENPWDNFGIDMMLHFFTEGDNVAGPLSGSGSYGGLVGGNVNQIQLSNPGSTNRIGSFFGTQQHYFENINWQEVLSQFANSQGGNSGGTSGKTKKKIKRAPGPPVVGW